jgi:hypothetical protein
LRKGLGSFFSIYIPNHKFNFSLRVKSFQIVKIPQIRLKIEINWEALIVIISYEVKLLVYASFFDIRASRFTDNLCLDPRSYRLPNSIVAELI